jgi:hypothetical protein
MAGDPGAAEALALGNGEVSAVTILPLRAVDKRAESARSTWPGSIKTESMSSSTSGVVPSRSAIHLGLYALSAGGDIGMLALSLVGGYADNLEEDMDWASDWGMPDDAYSRLNSDWVTETVAKGYMDMLSGAILGPLQLLDLFFDEEPLDDGPAMAYKWYPGAKLAKAALMYGFQGVRLAIRLGHLHHALPRYIAKALYGRDSLVLIQIPKHLHKAYHRYVDDAFKAAIMPTMRQGTKKLAAWINGDRAKMAQVLRVLRKATKEFEDKHKISGLSRALSEAVTGTK